MRRDCLSFLIKEHVCFLMLEHCEVNFILNSEPTSPYSESFTQQKGKYNHLKRNTMAKKKKSQHYNNYKSFNSLTAALYSSDVCTVSVHRNALSIAHLALSVLCMQNAQCNTFFIGLLLLGFYFINNNH